MHTFCSMSAGAAEAWLCRVEEWAGKHAAHDRNAVKAVGLAKALRQSCEAEAGNDARLSEVAEDLCGALPVELQPKDWLQRVWAKS